jgi:hypothetical protein
VDGNTTVFAQEDILPNSINKPGYVLEVNDEFPVKDVDGYGVRKFREPDVTDEFFEDESEIDATNSTFRLPNGGLKK